ncbi:MAG: nucleoside-diphosphate kinase [Candidatus Woesearchaeota archaeon]|jgi:nucleoside-diphosphate kinase|nr:nucleoside-diphosphate kinase [Candidatus Woesearchaeota archaeon]MDP7181131.1 nucleoside-diphosphate kinase [Candidatus Woesearchaeota archaeon]MDP7198248.1 nucleoside-diphosphate kinase [Candidatus Woesearchaeota archaeon]MDP7467084.1 nucleoside-diphosphate kinase [Candidatus Woesearchaeota archaeon]MDP7646752.1 nucleoside-diphosphate kinase [Candidatus Woesearchaeota archaeon]|tara:strand:+ start:78 stop:569 length:492 start_codon:yes stop_codon:yes gene_type:complete
MNEHTLVLLKPDTVKRQLSGEIITRFEKAGLKLVALKLTVPSKAIIDEHYGPEIAERNGDHVRAKLINDFADQPIIAMVISGVHAIEVVRKMVGGTEPKDAPPGTIRGDYGHYSRDYADSINAALANMCHASGNKEEAEKEIKIWFAPKEIIEYKTLHDLFHG